MKQELSAHHRIGDGGRPAGGQTYAPGLSIAWQDGPLGRGEDRTAPNGCFVETVIEAAVDRLNFYQAGPFNCTENGDALVALHRALLALNKRTNRREAEGTEGTHEGS